MSDHLERVRDATAMTHFLDNPPGSIVEGPRGQFIRPSTEEMVKRLAAAVAILATDSDESTGISMEYTVERILYPEHF